VLEGEITFVVGDQTVKASAGSFAFVPPGVLHAFHVDSPQARFLTVISPAGLEAFFDEVGEPAQAATLPPPLAGPTDVERIAAVAARYGQEILGPPPVPSP
jgi:hypothetical protein